MIEDWRVQLITLVPNVLETSSCLHVTVLVFLRLWAILKPMSYRAVHVKFRKTSIKIIWMTAISVWLLAVLTQSLMATRFYIIYRYIALHVFHTVPVICSALMYAVLVWTFRCKRNTKNDDSFPKKITYEDISSRRKINLVERIVIVLLVCYVPYLAWKQYFYMVITERVPFDTNSSEVITSNHLQLIYTLNGNH